jgi:hypothetical protein
MISYSQIIKNSENNHEQETQTNINLQKEQSIENPPSNVIIKYINHIKYHDQIILIKPYSKNIYSKSATYKWLYNKIDNNYFHYDYCLKLFGMLMKWVKLNNFKLAINEDILLAKFISLMYLLSNKQEYD